MSDAAVPTRRITNGPLHHWFGYYDKLHFDPSGQRVLGMQVDFEHRSPTAGDQIQLGTIDLAAGDTWQPIGRTHSWGWQQGCMLQWVPGSAGEVLWNEREDDRFVARMYDTGSGQSRRLPAAVYTISPDGRTALGTDFRRINDMRPGYGYSGITDPNADRLAPDDAGIYVVDLSAGNGSAGSDVRQIVSIAEVAAIPYPHGDISKAKHYFNHLLFNTDGSRFIFLHRWRQPGAASFQTRMLTAAVDGTDLHVVDDYGKMSHFIWRDPHTILAWSWQPSHHDAFYLYRDRTGEVAPIGLGKLTRNGHCTYLADTDWILNDCYPLPGSRLQELYLYHVPSDRRIDLGSFPAPEQYDGEWRCDLHPRANRDGSALTIDSAHEGLGRQIYLLDIAAVVGTGGAAR